MDRTVGYGIAAVALAAATLISAIIGDSRRFHLINNSAVIAGALGLILRDASVITLKAANGYQFKTGQRK
jgi:hypothetical protein